MTTTDDTRHPKAGTMPRSDFENLADPPRDSAC